MSEFKPLASLSSGLLARKGGARPAMRPQGDDLGWNDHGAATRRHVSRALTPMGAQAPRPLPSPAREQHAALAERMGVAAEEAVAAAKPEKARRAFTLRLDRERHLRLRLAAMVAGRSAQRLMTEALDQMLAGRRDIEELAEKMKGEK